MKRIDKFRNKNTGLTLIHPEDMREKGNLDKARACGVIRGKIVNGCHLSSGDTDGVDRRHL